MENFIQRGFKKLRRAILAGMILLFFNSATSPVVMQQDTIDELRFEVQQFEHEVSALQAEVCRLEEVLQDPMSLAQILLSDEQTFQQLVETHNQIPATKFTLAGSNIDVALTKHLYAALIDYSLLPDTPRLVVTSVRRKENRRSHHFLGNAIDLRANQNARKFLTWLNTDSGREWLERHNLRYLIEDNKSSRFLNHWGGIHRRSVYLNKYASGPHIHLEVKSSWRS
jgi:hypothetical protein